MSKPLVITVHATYLVADDKFYAESIEDIRDQVRATGAETIDIDEAP